MRKGSVRATEDGTWVGVTACQSGLRGTLPLLTSPIPLGIRLVASSPVATLNRGRLVRQKPGSVKPTTWSRHTPRGEQGNPGELTDRALRGRRTHHLLG